MRGEGSGRAAGEASDGLSRGWVTGEGEERLRAWGARGGRERRPAMGNIIGEKGRVGAVFGNWDRMEGGAAFPVRGVSGAGREMPVLFGGVVILDVSREVLSPLSWVAPALPAPLILYCHFLISLLHKTRQHSKLVPNSLGWKGEGRQLQSLLFLLLEAPSNCGVSAFSEGPLPVSRGAIITHSCHPLTL